MKTPRILWLAAAFLLVACSSKPRLVVVHVHPPREGRLAFSGIRFYVDGRPVTNVHITQPVEAPKPSDPAPENRFIWSFVMEGPPLKAGEYTEPKITADLMLPCGRRHLGLSLQTEDYNHYTDQKTDPEGAGREERTIDGPADAAVRSASTVTIWIDNESGSAGELTLGQMSVPVAGHSEPRLDSYVESCPEAGEVKWNGASLGTVEREKLPPANTVVIDPQANHCYLLEAHDYSTWQVRSRPPAPVSYAGSHIYVLPHPVSDDFMFKAAPISVPVHGEFGGGRYYGFTGRVCR